MNALDAPGQRFGFPPFLDDAATAFLGHWGGYDLWVGVDVDDDVVAVAHSPQDCLAVVHDASDLIDNDTPAERALQEAFLRAGWTTVKED